MQSAFDREVLAGRGVLRVTGDDAKTLLDGILTCDLDRVSAQTARLGALLSPQGKILFDFLVVGTPEGEAAGYYFDCANDIAADFAKRLSFYRLRAKVMIENLSDTHGVIASSSAHSRPTGVTFVDPRLPDLGFRTIAPLTAGAQRGQSAYLAHRLALGVPDVAEDFGFGDVFPHEMMMDDLHGVDFDKGCYVGQEVVSRMQHRGTARTRIIRATSAGLAPRRGSEVTAGGRVLGTMGSSV
ncbi:MAG: folate-binding protein, partial [Beijerinckiaceae bacterium]|nr:folate-binding protein [Beijerinckiaceae bacterium]